MFGIEFQLLALILQDAMAMINMDDFNVWIHACEQQTALFNVLCSWLWKIWQLPNIEIHCVMPLFVEMVIGLRFRGLNQDIMFTYNKQHQLFWM